MNGVYVEKEEQEIIGDCMACNSGESRGKIIEVRLGNVLVRFCNKHYKEMVVGVRSVT